MSSARRCARCMRCSASEVYGGCVLFVFFEYYGDHRDLHSFPTRRSSDLVVYDPVKRTSPNVIPDPLIVFEAPLNVIDRKSTRLNSSHIPLSRLPSSAC